MAVAVMGAGSCGLAAAAHLRAHRVPPPRVFGEPMESRRSRMPSGMFLKSTPSAPIISDPADTGVLDRFRAADGERLRR
jgi:hypothetical protein